MSVQRIRITLPEAEYSALLRLARAETRSLEHQIRHILRRELKSSGLLNDDAEANAQAGNNSGGEK